MSRSPHPDSTSPAFYRTLLRLLTRRTTIVVSMILLTTLFGGAWWAWIWIHHQLVPLVERNLKQLLGRPVELGQVEQVSFTGIRFGQSAIPATPTDADRVTTQAVEVAFSPLALLNRTLQLNVTLVRPNVYIEQAKNGQWISTTIQSQDSTGIIKTDLQAIRIQNGNLVLQPLPKPRIPTATVGFNQVSGTARFLEQNQRIRFEINAQAVRGGDLTVAGESRPRINETDLQVRGQNLLAPDITRVISLPIAFQAGRVDGNLSAQFRPNQPVSLSGTANLSQVTAQVANLLQRFTETQGQLRFQGNTIAFENVRTRFGSIPSSINGSLNTRTGYNLTAQVRSTTAKAVLNTLNLTAPVPVNGTLQANLQLQGRLQQPVLTGTVQTSGIVQVDRLNLQSVSSQFRLTTGTAPQVTFSNIRAIPQAGGQLTGRGQVQLAQQPTLAFNLRANNVPGDAIAQQYGTAPTIAIGQVSAIAQVTGSSRNLRTVVQFQAPQATYPGRGEVVIANQRVLLRNSTFNVAGGTVEATGQLVNGQFQASLDANRVGLNQIAQALRGQLSGTIQVTGTTNALRLADIRAAGQVRLSEGIAIINNPLTAQVRWTGDRLFVQEATAPGLLASGTIAVQTEGVRTPQISALDLNVQAQDLKLQQLTLNLPQAIALAGQANFNGQVIGTPNAPTATGDLQVRNLRVNGVAFDPLLAGRLDYRARQRTQLQLTGQQVIGTPDRITLTLNANNRPVEFFVQRNQAIARGRAVGETLLTELQNIPLAVLQEAVPNLANSLGTVSGNLSGTVAVNLNQATAQGEIAIATPRLGRIRGDQFQGRFEIANGITRLTQGELRRGESRIALSGDVPIVGTQPIQFQIFLNQENIQDLLQTLSVFNIADFATGLQAPTLGQAADLRPLNSIEFANAPLMVQLRQFEQIQRIIAQQRRQPQQTTAALPPLSALNGQLTGTIAVTGTLRNGLNIGFNLRGSDLNWGTYNINRLVAQGQFANGTLSLSPLRIDLNNGTLAFSGQVGAKTLNGQLSANNVPVELLQPFLNRLPIDVAGRLNATATLSGSLNNPGAIGTLNLVNARLNNQAIQQAALDFRYADSRLNFGSNIQLTGTQPLEISGSIPVVLPFASAQPVSNQIQLQAQIANEGLSLLNLFTDQITWVNGQGQVNVAVTGTLNQPIVQGTVTVQNATLRTPALPKPLTNVTGVAQFNRDAIAVENFQAQFSQGQITAQGNLPIFTNRTVQNLLTVALNNLTLNLAERYQGDASGTVVVTGTVLNPALGGTIRLSNGEVVAATGSGSSATATNQSRPANRETSIAFNDLRLVLANDVRVTRPPLLSFTAEGDLVLNGTLANPRPAGTIRLTRGQVNLFTTQFRLERDEKQTAQFVPSFGFDPILNVQLFALVPETTGMRLPQSQFSSEIIDNPLSENFVTSIGTLRTIRVEAQVTGRASELSQNLTLTSTPNRSNAEILALIGGNLINTLGQADTTLGIANIAGTALSNRLQAPITALGQAIGLSDFRIFPTIVTSRTANTSVLGLAAEAVVDVTGNFSVSVSRVFATDEPFRYNLLYRINDDLRVRASTDFAGESRALIQYETRF